MSTKVKAIIVGILLIAFVFIAPEVFTGTFNSVKDTAISCDRTIRDTKLPGITPQK